MLTEVEVLRAPTAAFGVFDFLSQNPRWASQFAAGVETELRRVELEHELSAVYLDNLTQLLGSHREQMVALMVGALFVYDVCIHYTVLYVLYCLRYTDIATLPV